ncbi:MAG TPA: efflux RND transporter permease subunit, partial [Pirellulales bacterium]
SIIPMIAVPVAIIGTFTAMALLGFSLNNLSLFGLVLAIGIVVDDAIVVVEAVEHHIEHGLSPRDATIQAMEQVSRPVIAVGLVLSAVFVPCAFISGITGQFFRQFALTISVSTVISAFNSLTLSPALSAMLLRPRAKHSAPPLPWPAFVIAGGWLGWTFLTPWATQRFAPAGWWLEHFSYVCAAAGAIAGGVLCWPINKILAFAFAVFNRLFDLSTGVYTWIVGKMLTLSLIVLVVYGGLLVLTYQRLEATPKGFIPGQDMGYLLLNVQLPDSASMERTRAVMHQVGTIAKSIPGVDHVSEISGQSFVLNAIGSNFGTLFVRLKDYSDRRDPMLSSNVILGRMQAALNEKVYDAIVNVFPPPPVRGVGRAGGFMMMVEDRGDAGPIQLANETNNIVAEANKMLGKLMVFPSSFRANVPQLKAIPDVHECMEKGVSLTEFADALRIFQGSLYVNDFNLFGRTWQVIVQADWNFRDQIEDIPRLRVRNSNGDMVPLGSLADIKEVNGPLVVTRYNRYPAAAINGTGLAGVSSTDAIEMMNHIADDHLPTSMRYEWTEMAFLELLAGNTAMKIFGLAVLMVFLVLAAQYESWSLPLAIILVVPMCILSAVVGVNIFGAMQQGFNLQSAWGAILGVNLSGSDINIFTRIGFVVLVGLASKNAILIVEFAKRQREQGASRRAATLEACRLRLRPIVMTSLAFILGVVPLILATGAGAEMRRTLGTAVFSGMLGVTVFGLFLTPVFFSTIDWLGGMPIFATQAMQLTGRWSIAVVSLKPLRDWLAQRPAVTAKATRKRLPVTEPQPINVAATNGHPSPLNGGNAKGDAAFANTITAAAHNVGSTASNGASGGAHASSLETSTIAAEMVGNGAIENGDPTTGNGLHASQNSNVTNDDSIPAGAAPRPKVHKD